MGTTSQKIQYLGETKNLLKDSINSLGGNITSQTTFRQYATELDSIYAKLPKVTGTGSNITLTPTLKGRLSSVINGDTEQKTNLYNNDIEQGAISEGADVSANNRIRTASYIEVVPSTQLYIGFSGCDDMYVSYYNSSKTFVSAYGWATGNANVSIPANIYYIRVAFRKNDNSNITPSSISNVQIGNVPNPDYPQEIKSVTGLQKVSVEGKNLWSSEWEQGYINANGVNENNNNIIRTRDYISVIPNQHYAIKRSIVGDYINVRGYDKNKNFIGSGGTVISLISGSSVNNPMITTRNECVIVPKDNVYYLKFNDATNNLATEYMMVKGDTPEDYEPYQSQEYEINLGKNLWSFNSSYSSTGYATILNQQPYKLSKGNYTLSFASVTVTSSILFRFFNKDKSRYYDARVTPTVQTPVLNAEEDIYYVSLIFNEADSLTNIQLEKGSQATPYSPYFTPIKLNKIGDYQDHIIGTPYNWFIKRQVVDVIFDGTENEWAKSSNQNVDRYYINTNLYKNDANSKCNYFTKGGVVETVGIWTNNVNTQLLFNFAEAGTTTLQDWKIWLSTHNLELVQPLSTETTTPITDTELIEDLNNLYYAQSNDDTTNISVSGNLPMILSVSALKGDTQ